MGLERIETQIRQFKEEEYPRIAVSVGMLDTGFDCPKVVNIVFCRSTRSEIPYKHIRGRGTCFELSTPIIYLSDALDGLSVGVD